MIKDWDAVFADMEERLQSMVGSELATVEYPVRADVIERYAALFGYTADRFRSDAAAIAEGFVAQVAPAPFAAVYSMAALLEPLRTLTPEVPFGWNLHAGESIQFGAPVCAGDVLTTRVRLANARRKAGKLYYELRTETVNDRGQHCASAVSTCVVRVP
jgi:acyl dehydratase